jgi:hypothetical protein
MKGAGRLILRFFCTFVCGRSGLFHLLENENRTPEN